MEEDVIFITFNSIRMKVERYIWDNRADFHLSDAASPGLTVGYVVMSREENGWEVKELFKHDQSPRYAGLGKFILRLAITRLLERGLATPETRIYLHAAGVQCDNKSNRAMSAEQLGIHNLSKAELRQRIIIVMNRNRAQGKRLLRSANSKGHYPDLAWDDRDSLMQYLCSILNQERLIRFYEGIGFKMTENWFGFETMTSMSSDIRTVMSRMSS